MAAVIICSDFGAQENKISQCFHCFPIYFPWSDGTGCHDLVFWMLSFKSTFSLSSFTFIKRLFNSSSLSAIRVVSSAYLKLLMFLPAILIPACDISNFLEEIFSLSILLFSSISLHWSLRKAFLSLCDILWNSSFKWVYSSSRTP